MLPFAFSDRAVRDMAQARDWYDRKGTGLGTRFLNAVVAAAKAASERP